MYVSSEDVCFLGTLHYNIFVSSVLGCRQFTLTKPGLIIEAASNGDFLRLLTKAAYFYRS